MSHYRFLTESILPVKSRVLPLKSGETEPFRAFWDGHNQHGAQFVICLVRGEVQLIETKEGKKMLGSFYLKLGRKNTPSLETIAQRVLHKIPVHCGYISPSVLPSVQISLLRSFSAEITAVWHCPTAHDRHRFACGLVSVIPNHTTNIHNHYTAINRSPWKTQLS